MGKQINVLGWSIWSQEFGHHRSTSERFVGKAFYSPGVIAGYCMFISLFIGTILYGINLFRRGQVRKGSVLILLASVPIVVITVFHPFIVLGSSWLGMLSGLVALNLYTFERPHFQRVLLHGGQCAKWWPPLIGISVIALLSLK